MPTGHIDQFQAKYFRWALKSFAAEIGCGFARLETTKTSMMFHLLSTMRSLSHEDQMKFGGALVKRRRLIEVNASEIDGEVMSPEEISMCQQFFDNFALGRTAEELEWDEEQRNYPDRFKISRRRLLTMVSTDLGLKLGNEVENDGSVLTYQKVYDEWTISTEIEIGAANQALSYHHSIHARMPTLLTKALAPGSAKFHQVLRPIISPVSWMGISGGAMHWRYVHEETVPCVVNALSSFCSEFIEALPVLLDGISPQTEKAIS